MLKKASGNMYEFITHTWNPISGECPHECKYCYAMYKYNKTIKDKIRLRDDSFRDDFKTGNFIFVGSGIDIFADEIPHIWIKKIMDYCAQDNIDLFGTRNRFDNSSWYNTSNVPVTTCSREIDSFRVNNSIAPLVYPVGLLTADEVIMGGAAGNSSTSNSNFLNLLFLVPLKVSGHIAFKLLGCHEIGELNTYFSSLSCKSIP